MSNFDRNDDKYWKWGMIYINADDPAIWLPKRTGLGWTLNFAHKMSFVYLVLLLVLPTLVALFFTRALKP
ncbi:DUF5808 domain-containing protein [Mucilaginibacter dorajii]|uniref:DUF5808 domain-containing protein n=1 Tax=Mucilaginibacter dorajii TaxID=692994 RepID=A0ABP7QNC2_9SPHI|nr:DUF5808 domain-containing protein [Mucilaginibacter dorajii]MCS3735867.1 putative membrane protein [Mucilaginibacter dorajii]